MTGNNKLLVPNLDTLVVWSRPRLVNTVKGLRMLRTGKPTSTFWRAWETCKAALKAAGVSLTKGSDGWQVCWWQPAHSNEVELSDLELTRLEYIRPKLLPYQTDSVRQLLLAIKRVNAGLDASQTGTGKTYTSLAVCCMLNRPAYVVCPKSVISTWQRAADHFGISIQVNNYEQVKLGNDGVVVVTQHEGLALPREAVAALRDFAGVSPPKARKHFQWTLPKETIIIVDECHRLKAVTQNQQLGLAAIAQGYTMLALSATAADNPLQMKFIGTMLRLFDSKGFWPWCLRHGVRQGRFGHEFDGDPEHLAAIHHDIFPERGSRIRIADLGDMFPETQIQAEAYEVNGKTEEINRIYAEMQEEIDRLRRRVAKDYQASVLTQMLRARQKIELLKVPVMVEMAEDAIDSGLSVALFVNFDASADALMQRLDTKCSIRGGQRLAERDGHINAFQADHQHVIVCNIKAGGLGVSLHGSPTARMRMSIISPSFSGIDLVQALGRVHRAGGAKSIQRIFFAAGTIEEQICKNVRTKLNRLVALTDGDLSPKDLF